MPEYHVGCGAFGIYAGTLNKKGDMWLHKSDVTNEVLGCARKRNLYLRIQMSEAEIGFHFSLRCCNFTPINRNLYVV